MFTPPDPHAAGRRCSAASGPQQFMRRHWQKRPLLIRQAVPGATAPLDRAALFALAAREGVESRLIRRQGTAWSLKHGPFATHRLAAAQAARLDTPRPGAGPARAGRPCAAVAVSLRAAGAAGRPDDLLRHRRGGVGPHLDSYDVFLLQVHGRRRWRIGRAPDATLVPGVPLKILAHFQAEEEWLLEPGDMLYLPPRWAHDGVAEGECMTCSVGFRSTSREEFGREVLQHGLDALAEAEDTDGAPPTHSQAALYRDPWPAGDRHPGPHPAGDAGLRHRRGGPAGGRPARPGLLAR